ncbi:MAG: tetratricopeptide repeat protein, partial [Myxococcota bacterium]
MAAGPTIVVLILIAASLPRLALAQDGPDPDVVARARNHFEAGRSYYEDGRFADAAREFEETYRLTTHPDVLYNLGSTYDQMERYEDALDAYAGYLREVTDSPDAPRIERRARELRVMIQASAREEQEAAPPETLPAGEPAPSSGGVLGPIPTVVAFAGAVVWAVVAGAAWAGANSVFNDLETGCQP